MYYHVQKIDASTVKYSGSEMLISTPARCHIIAVGFLLFWLIGWTLGEITALTQIIRGGGGLEARAFLLVWFLGWTIGGGVAISFVLWNLFGRDILVVSMSMITVEKRILFFTSRRRYEKHKVRDFRILKPDDSQIPDSAENEKIKKMMGSAILKRFLPPSCFAFNYEGKEIRCQTSLTSEGAVKIFALLKNYHFIEDDRSGW